MSESLVVVVVVVVVVVIVVYLVSLEPTKTNINHLNVVLLARVGYTLIRLGLKLESILSISKYALYATADSS